MNYIFEIGYDFNYETNKVKKQIDRHEVLAETKDEIAYKKNWSNEVIGTICKKGKKKITSSSNNELDTIDVFNCRSLNTYCSQYFLLSDKEDLTDEEINNIFGVLQQGLREFVVGQIREFDEKMENCLQDDIEKTYIEKAEENEEDDEDEEENEEE